MFNGTMPAAAALRQLQQADGGNRVGLLIKMVDGLVFLGRTVDDGDQIVILLGHLWRLAGIGLHRAVAHGCRFVKEHVHVGQHRITVPLVRYP